MSARPDVIVVGGGIWAASTALHLVRRVAGLRVLVLERGPRVACETTAQAAGQIGQLRANPLMVRAVGRTLALLETFHAETGHDPGFVRAGSLHLALSPERLAAFRSTIDGVRCLGVTAEEVDHASARTLVPRLETHGLAGAVFLPGDGYVDAAACGRAYAAAAADAGVEFRTGCDVTAIRTAGGRAVGVDTAAGPLDSGRVVVAGGPWTGLLLAPLGLALPAVAIRLQQLRTVADPSLPAHHPVVRIPDASCYLRPEAGGLLYGYIDPHATVLDPAGGHHGSPLRTADIAPDESLMAEARDRLAGVLPSLASLAIDHYRQGMVTCTPDASYVLGAVPGVTCLFVATGCSAMGISGSAAVGAWLAELVVDGSTADDLAPFAPERFGQRAADHGWLVAECRRVYADYYGLTAGGTTYGWQPSGPGTAGTRRRATD